MTEAVQIGLDYGVTVYDGCYVALSRQVSVPLLTLDEKLVNSLAASSFDVQLFTNFLVPPLSA
jgi:predicted nucleic acid-binding protein